MIAAQAGAFQIGAEAALPIDDPSRQNGAIGLNIQPDPLGISLGFVCLDAPRSALSSLRTEAMLTARIARTRARPKPIARCARRMCNKTTEKGSVPRDWRNRHREAPISERP
jgi:hypothetical protein